MKEKVLFQTKIFKYVGFDNPKELLTYELLFFPRLNEVVLIDGKKYRIVDIYSILSTNLVRIMVQVCDI